MPDGGAYCDWIAVDWGTSRLRAWAMQDGEAKAEATSDAGMGALDRDGFEPALVELVEPWLGAGRTPVVACGMVGSRQGWVEAPYRAAPCAPLGPPVAAPVRDARLSVSVVPGVKQPRPADVMRGEETQVAGVLAARPQFDGVLVLPGSHSKWVHVSAGEIVSFRTFLTGEAFAALSAHTVLRHSMAEGWDAAVFGDAVAEALSRPEQLAARLFSIRADDLLTGLPPGAGRARLSGTLIGAELAAAKPWWLGREVVVVGAAGDPLADAYATALAGQGLDPRRADAEAAVRAGLSAARTLVEEDA